ncbi:DNA-binding MarR family transcriptional regulator [Agromyces flavus]|uniref:DNA-binding MarR family transcriptional regulator n=1 Tax=Agromyces flavus TaxID=589382 RepID=A0A1H1Y9B8_9MICO|nr:MarR family transcriptional regulator [Agromyces flavus]MCP2366619.1 DNA-binding MarR family transcriptional regulator [Agromyces flavus]GGI45038.1 putative HTH-type transcriptional regulator [Agromyces flavus]SDT17992.1 DNA-binding transcriptional regulator, MarR family [Agromyces flavus]
MTATVAPAPARPKRATLAEQSTELRLSVMRLARRMRQERADTELSATQYAALAWTASEGPLTPGRLAELERVTPPSMNRTVNCLVESGLLVREGSPDDGRKILLHATEAGHEIVRETRRRRDAWLAKRLAALTPDERNTIAAATDILRRLTDQ